jgi:putative ABC transport system permease protein
MSTAQRASFYSRVLERVQSVPGVKSTGLIEDLFIGSRSEQTVTTEQRSGTVSQRLQLRSDEVTPGFFDTLVAPLLRGRFFSAEDAFRHPPVVIVNETMARRLWAGRDPLGQRVKFDSGNPGEGWFTVIGVVKDIHRQGLEKESIAQMFEPLGIDPPRLATLLVRTSLDDPLKLAGTVRTAVQQVDKSVPLYDMATLENRLGAFLTQRRFQTSLLIGFAAIALLMAAIGIYGLIQYSVAIRTREIGIRMAVGAQAGEIFRMIIGEGLKLSLAGLALGLVGAIYAGRAGRSLLFGVKPTDPGTFIAVSVSLVAAAVAACYFPARRAMKVEPLAALRQE